MIMTGVTIMYICKNRNSTYYSRINIPKKFKHLGFPAEIRFSLHTKYRKKAIDRSLQISLFGRHWLNSLEHLSKPNHKILLEQFRQKINDLRDNNFTIEELNKNAPKRKSKPPAKSKAPIQIARFKKSNNEALLTCFLTFKEAEGITHRSIQQLKLRINTFLELLEKPVQKVEAKDAMNYKVVLLKTNKSHKTQKDTLAAIKQFFSWLKLNGEINHNPIDGIKLKTPVKKASEYRVRWTKSDLKILFSHKNFAKHPNEILEQRKKENFWIPLILLFSGARASEICQLSTRDIVNKDGVWCIDINDKAPDRHLKTAAATRFVPIHQKLIELGLLEYVKFRHTNNKENLFDFNATGKDKDWYKTFSIRFSRVLTAVGFVGKHRPTSHSFRHTFIDELQQLGIPEHETSELVGHSKSNITYGRYGKSVNIERLNAIVQSLDFELIFEF